MIGITNVKIKPNKKIEFVEHIESTGTQCIDTGIPTQIDSTQIIEGTDEFTGGASI